MSWTVLTVTATDMLNVVILQNSEGEMSKQLEYILKLHRGDCQPDHSATSDEENADDDTVRAWTLHSMCCVSGPCCHLISKQNTVFRTHVCLCAPQLSLLSQSHVECFRWDLWQCPCHGWGGYLPASYRGGLVSISCQSMLNLCWLQWYWDKFFSQYWYFHVSESFHQWSIFIHSFYCQFFILLADDSATK